MRRNATFYAVIEKVRDQGLLVRGMEVNDINFRGEFDLSLDADTVFEWRHTEISADELEVGDTIAVTYTGMVKESYPARIDEVLKVQLLDDEK